MRRLVLLVALLALLAPRPSHAGTGGVNLSWTDCGTFGTSMRTFACNTNVGSNVLVASFVPPVNLDHMVGIEGVIDLCSMAPVLPAWWMMFDEGTCRQTAISSSFDFTSGPFNCTDPWGGQAVGGMDYTIGQSWEFNAARIRTVCAIPSTAIQPILQGVEYYAYKVTIVNAKSTGTGACGGCTESVCIILNSLKLAQQAGYGDYTLTNPISSYNVQWQGPVVGCPFVVPTKNKSWGQVKALYR